MATYIMIRSDLLATIDVCIQFQVIKSLQDQQKLSSALGNHFMLSVVITRFIHTMSNTGAKATILITVKHLYGLIIQFIPKMCLNPWK